jgi:hypothetical protein
MAAIKFAEESCTSEKFGFPWSVQFLLDVALNTTVEKNLTIWH